MINEALVYQSFFAFMVPMFRIAGFLLLAPIFSSPFMPSRIRVLIAFTMAIVFFDVSHARIWFEGTVVSLLLTAMTEILLGLAMGAFVQILFDALIVSGQVIAMSMGLGFATMIDPQNGSSVPVISQIFALSCFMLFLSIDGHLQLFELFYLSFTSMPVGLVSLASIELKQWLSMTSLLFSLAMHIALPTVAAILLVQLSFAVISRAAPSMNLFAVGFPLTILLGFLFLYILLDEVFLVFLNYLNNQFESFSNLFFL